MKTICSATLLSIAASGVAVSAFAPASVLQSSRVATHLYAEPEDEKKSVTDELWGKPPEKDGSSVMSKALPFVAQPKMLDGSLPGDAGFE